jgi:prevent-host-death family protein
MKKANITEARNNLSALIDGLKRGSGVLIVDRGRPVARLEPISGSRSDVREDDRIATLIRGGLVRPARAPLPKALTEHRPPAAARQGSVVRALLDEREQGR